MVPGDARDSPHVGGGDIRSEHRRRRQRRSLPLGHHAHVCRSRQRDRLAPPGQRDRPDLPLGGDHGRHRGLGRLVCGSLGGQRGRTGALGQDGGRVRRRLVGPLDPPALDVPPTALPGRSPAVATLATGGMVRSPGHRRRRRDPGPPCRAHLGLSAGDEPVRGGQPRDRSPIWVGASSAGRRDRRLVRIADHQIPPCAWRGAPADEVARLRRRRRGRVRDRLHRPLRRGRRGRGERGDHAQRPRPPAGGGSGDPPLPPLRHRRRHQPHARLRCADGHAGRGLPRAVCCCCSFS